MTTAVDQPGVEDAVSASPPFILYLDGAEYGEEMRSLAVWVADLLLPVYGREVSSQQPWCPRWWEHLEAVARLHALWLAWQELADPSAGLSGPAVWHRDHLGPVLAELRSSAGPFAGCKAGSHRAKQSPTAEPYGTDP
ncbi:DUF4913 domain-containing protein [Streptomyces sp. MA5143a]|uniref:DUF4913 domain-containing protein n=1 Tax=Streptomyces sp. MA5143a TaxID=2083010 RepID=UPI000D1A9AD9|nr:DUF4913 domain-containing protein [Streptomyces sp. MA5143a]SPF07228.1 hypothetical protein SMA5143A_8077 [Streptomyces sp. MA5143a]